MSNNPTGPCRSSITTVVHDIDQALSTAELDDQFGTIFETIGSRERKPGSGMTTRQAPECRRGWTMSMGNTSATPKELFADRILAQEEFAAKVVQEEFAAKVQVAADQAKRGMAWGSGGLRSVEDQELDAYSPHTSESDAFDVRNRVKAMVKVLNISVETP